MENRHICFYSVVDMKFEMVFCVSVNQNGFFYRDKKEAKIKDPGDEYPDTECYFMPWNCLDRRIIVMDM